MVSKAQRACITDEISASIEISGSKKKAIVATAKKLALRLRYIALTEDTYCLGVIK